MTIRGTLSSIKTKKGSENIDSFVEGGETTLNTDSLPHSTCSSPAMNVSTCKEQQARKARDESQESNTSLIKVSREHTPQPQKKRGTSQDRIKSPV